jgi:hypothetical protein
MQQCRWVLKFSEESGWIVSSIKHLLLASKQRTSSNSTVAQNSAPAPRQRNKIATPIVDKKTTVLHHQRSKLTTPLVGKKKIFINIGSLSFTYSARSPCQHIELSDNDKTA